MIHHVHRLTFAQRHRNHLPARIGIRIGGCVARMRPPAVRAIVAQGHPLAHSTRNFEPRDRQPRPRTTENGAGAVFTRPAGAYRSAAGPDRHAGTLRRVRCCGFRGPPPPLTPGKRTAKAVRIDPRGGRAGGLRSAAGKDRPDRPGGQERDRGRLGQGRRQEHDRRQPGARTGAGRQPGRPDGCRRLRPQHSASAGRQSPARGDRKPHPADRGRAD